MIALAVLAIVVTAAIPNLQSLINGNRLTAASNELLASLQTARIEAVRRNKQVAVCLSPDPAADAPVCGDGGAGGARGWLVFVDTDRDGDYDGDDDEGTASALLRTTTAPRGITLRASPSIPDDYRVSYNADGFARDDSGIALLAGAIGLCMPTERPSENARLLVVGPGGRLAIGRRDTDGDCSAAPEDPA